MNCNTTHYRANSSSVPGDPTNSGTPPYHYAWSHGDTTATVSGLSSATYYVSITTGNNCHKTDTIVVTQPTAVNVSVTPVNASCSLLNGSLTAHPAGGTGAFTYHWNTGDSTAAVLSLGNGNYSLTVHDANNCSVTTAASVAGSTAVSETHSASPASCFGLSDGTASVNITSGTLPYSYAWNRGDTTALITGLSSATYYVTITNAGNCHKLDTVFVDQPTAINISVTPTNAACGQANGMAVANANGGTAGYLYDWGSNGTGDTISSLLAGTYHVTVTDANLCTASALTNISSSGSFTETHTSSPVLCAGDANGSAMLNITGGTAPITIHWNTGDSTTSLGNLAASTYQVTITDGNNCQKIDTVVVNQPVQLTASTSATADSCFGDFTGTATVTQLGGTTPYSNIHWSTGGNTNTITGLASSSYTVTITDANNCSASASASVTEPAQLAIATTIIDPSGGNNGSAQVSHVTGGSTPYTYKWNTGDSTAGIYNLPAGIYTVTTTDANGCSVSTSVTVGLVTGVADPGEKLLFNLAPNPATNQITVTLDKTVTGSIISLKDIVGHTILSKPIESLSTTLDVSQYGSGVYFVEVKQNGVQAVKQVVIGK